MSAGKWANVSTTYAVKIPTVRQQRRRPANEVGIYLHSHAHDWRERGTHTWPNGDALPVFVCYVCGDVICNEAVDA